MSAAGKRACWTAMWVALALLVAFAVHNALVISDLRDRMERLEQDRQINPR